MRKSFGIAQISSYIHFLVHIYVYIDYLQFFDVNGDVIFQLLIYTLCWFFCLRVFKVLPQGELMNLRIKCRAKGCKKSYATHPKSCIIYDYVFKSQY